ncbi:MAG: GH32 C-terminal domain-containing protein [Verrucomicrobiota bacterium]
MSGSGSAALPDKSDYGLFSSPDLKKWEGMSTLSIPGTSECPDFFEIPVDGDKRNTRWVFYGGNGRYLIGKFDGRTFTPQSGPHALNAGNCFYASQTYSDIPVEDGRRILVPWGQMSTPGMPFNQMIGLPVELTLRETEEGPRLFANPVSEFDSLVAKTQSIAARALAPGENPLAGIEGELLEVVASIGCGEAAQVGLNLRGIEVAYDVHKQELSCLGKTAVLKPVNGQLRLRVMVDRTSLDIFGGDGRVYMPMGVIVPEANHSLSIYAKAGTAQISSLQVRKLKSAWE